MVNHPSPIEKGSGKVKVRRATADDVPALYACQAAAYANYGPGALCTERQLTMQIKAFPEGQLVATVGKQIVGYAMSLIVHLDDKSPWYSYAEITGNGTFSTHDPAGEDLYGADIAVHPDFRGNWISGKLYEARMNILKRFNLRRLVAGDEFRAIANMPAAYQRKSMWNRSVVEHFAILPSLHISKPDLKLKACTWNISGTNKALTTPRS